MPKGFGGSRRISKTAVWLCEETNMTKILVQRGDLEHIKDSIDLGEYDKALEVLEELLRGSQ